MTGREKKFNPVTNNPQTQGEAEQVESSLNTYIEKTFALSHTGIQSFLESIVLEKLKKHERYASLLGYHFSPGEYIIDELERIVRAIRDKTITTPEALTSEVEPLADLLVEMELKMDEHGVLVGTPEQEAQMDVAVSTLLGILNKICPEKLLSRLTSWDIENLCTGCMLGEEPLAPVVEIADPELTAALEAVWGTSKNVLDYVPTVTFDAGAKKLIITNVVIMEG